jgi:hypothetical protein
VNGKCSYFQNVIKPSLIERNGMETIPDSLMERMKNRPKVIQAKWKEVPRRNGTNISGHKRFCEMLPLLLHRIGIIKIRIEHSLFGSLCLMGDHIFVRLSLRD